jgi:hypothetical protein
VLAKFRMTVPGRAVLVAVAVALFAAAAAIALAAPSTASACPPQGCHVPPDEEPAPKPPPGPPPPKYRIYIDKLIAHETEDYTGINDEAYIRVKGTKVWGPVSINPFQAQYPNVSMDVTGPIWVSLYDDDDIDSDDWLGDAYAPLPSGVGLTAWGFLKFKEDGADYTMNVRVLRLS